VELKDSDIKNLLDEFHGRFHQAKQQSVNFENKVIEMIESKEQKNIGESE
jgi:hypothetical protein